jgi:hypothetical protein
MTNAVLYDVLSEVQAKIVALALSGLANGNVVVQQVPTDGKNFLPTAAYPCVIVAPFAGEVIDPAAGTNLRDDIGYQVVAAILAKDHQDAGKFNAYLLWRERIRKAFINQGLAAGENIWKCEIRPLDVVERSAWFDKSTFVSGQVLVFTSRETRG